MTIIKMAAVEIYKMLYGDTTLITEEAVNVVRDIYTWLNNGNLKTEITLDDLAERYKKERNI